MSRSHTVAKLPEKEFEFVIRCILDGLTDRETSAAYHEEFKKKLAKSSLGRWRASAGDELADRYRMARVQARQLLENLKEDPNADKYQILMRGVEERLLTVTREAIAIDPIKMLGLRQEEEKRRLKERELELRREQLHFEREKLRGVQIDRVKLGDEFTEDLLEFIGKDPDGLRWFTKNAKQFHRFIATKYASAQS